MFHDPKLWLAISFLVFLSLMIKYIFPFLTRALNNKQKQIADNINQAKSMKEQAEKLLEDAKKYNEESLAYSKKLIEEAKVSASKLLADSQKSIEEEITKKMDLTKDRIRLEEEGAIREIKSNIINAAIKTIEERATKLSDNSAMSITNKAIDNIGKVVH
jgi:F-type H+-transporting ATPase subunit b